MRSANIAVIVATFGLTKWEITGDQAAKKVRDEQTVRPVIMREHLHHGTLSEARNSAVEWLSKDTMYDDVGWLIFLDADDELHPNFVEELTGYQGDADVLQTSVRGFREEIDRDRLSFAVPDLADLAIGRKWLEPAPVFHAQKLPLLRQNYLTIGSPVRREIFLNVAGFDEWPVLEDWAFWLKCAKAGANFSSLPEAVYYINDDHQRNLNINADVIAAEIRAKYK